MNHSQDYFNFIPPYLYKFMCQCSQPHPVGYSTLDPNVNHRERVYKTGKTIDDRIRESVPLGMFCLKCLLAYRYSVLHVVRECDGCGKFYLPHPKPETYPIKYFLCQSCDIPPP